MPGFDISPLFPRQARVTDKFSMVRSLHHDTGDHFAGGHRMLTTKDMGVSGANSSQRFPGIGAIVSRELGPRRRGMPAYVGVPNIHSIGLSPGYHGGHMLGAQHNPFQSGGDPNSPAYSVANLNLAQGLSLQRLEDRRSLTTHFDSALRSLENHGTAEAMDRFSQEAFEFVTGPTARQAFNINQEDPRLRDTYGRNNFGQSTLLARRLVEAGATFVTVTFSGWDHHWDLQAGMERYLPMVDSAVAGLFQDLDQRGLLETTLVVLCGEFSRTPRMNDGGNGGAARSMGTPGRDHWGNSMFCLMGGGGIKGGQIVGSTDRLGTRPNSRPVTPANIHATIYQVPRRRSPLAAVGPVRPTCQCARRPDPDQRAVLAVAQKLLKRKGQRTPREVLCPFVFLKFLTSPPESIQSTKECQPVSHLLAEGDLSMADEPQTPPTTQDQANQIPTDYSALTTVYTNFCRVNVTPEELVLDFGLNPQISPTPTESVKLTHRVVMNYFTTKRLLLALNNVVVQHENAYGALELDHQRRLRTAPRTGGNT